MSDQILIPAHSTVTQVQHVYSQQEADKLVAEAYAKGKGEGYHAGWAEAEGIYNPPPPPPKCPECGCDATVEHTPFEQEYAGACYTAPQDWGHCTNEECEHTWKICDYDCDHMVQENRRGW